MVQCLPVSLLIHQTLHHVLLFLLTTGCLRGWRLFKGSCYKWFSNASSWKDAYNYCLGLGANLASIPNNGTNSFLTSLTHEPSWIGGYRIQKLWLWTDGSYLRYKSWKTGEPNNLGGNQDKISFNWDGLGQWDDAKATKKFPFICQRPGTDQ